MSKVKLLLDVVQDMRSLADSIQAVAEAIAGNEAHAEASAETKAVETTAPAITIEQVRDVLAPLSQSGKSAEVRGLLQKYGANKLSEIAPAQYGSLIKDAEVLGNGKK